MEKDKFILDMEKAAIVIVDVQERLADVMDHRQQVVENCLHLIEASKLLGLPLVVTEQYPKGLGPTVSDIVEALPVYEPVEKLTFDCCGEPSFLKSPKLAGRKQIVLAGMEAHICVLQTALGLLRKDFAVHMVSDAVCSRTKANFLTGIGFAKDAGAVITSTETVLFQLLKRAGTDEFKAISRRIR